MSQCTLPFGDIYRLSLISLIEKCMEFIHVSEQFHLCSPLVKSFTRYSAMKVEDLTELAPDDLFDGEITDALKEQLMNAEEVLREYGYETGFKSLVASTRALNGRFVDLLYERDLVTGNFRAMVLKHYGSKLVDVVFPFNDAVTAESNLDALLGYLVDFTEGSDSERRERNARRNYYLRTLKAVRNGEIPPTLLELETGFSVYYDSILNDCFTVGNYGPI